MNFICTADLHLRKSVPPCRKQTEEEWINYQFSILDDIFQYCLEYKADLIIAGDIFDKAVPSTIILNKTISLFKNYIAQGISIYSVAGNHDLPMRNIGLIEKSGYGTLLAANVISFHADIYQIDFGLKNDSEYTCRTTICHHLVFPEDEMPPNINALSDTELFTMYNSQFIICGDNHHGFISEQEEMLLSRLLIMPGCITIQDSSLIDYKPRVYHLKDTNNFNDYILAPIYINNDTSVLSREHLDIQYERNERIDSFIESLKTNHKITLSFQENLKQVLLQKEITSDIKDIIQELTENYDG